MRLRGDQCHDSFTEKEQRAKKKEGKRERLYRLTLTFGSTGSSKTVRTPPAFSSLFALPAAPASASKDASSFFSSFFSSPPPCVVVVVVGSPTASNALSRACVAA